MGNALGRDFFMAKETSKKATLAVKIQTPSGITWEGVAHSVSSVNSKGPFDILPEHARFITVLEKQTVEVRTINEVKKFTIERGVLSVTDNKVSILAGL